MVNITNIPAFILQYSVKDARLYDHCLTALGAVNTRAVGLRPCLSAISESKGNNLWRVHPTTYQLYNVITKYCLLADLTLGPCKKGPVTKYSEKNELIIGGVCVITETTKPYLQPIFNPIFGKVPLVTASADSNHGPSKITDGLEDTFWASPVDIPFIELFWNFDQVFIERVIIDFQYISKSIRILIDDHVCIDTISNWFYTTKISCKVEGRSMKIVLYELHPLRSKSPIGLLYGIKSVRIEAVNHRLTTLPCNKTKAKWFIHHVPYFDIAPSLELANTNKGLIQILHTLSENIALIAKVIAKMKLKKENTIKSQKLPVDHNIITPNFGSININHIQSVPRCLKSKRSNLSEDIYSLKSLSSYKGNISKNSSYGRQNRKSNYMLDYSSKITNSCDEKLKLCKVNNKLENRYNVSNDSIDENRKEFIKNILINIKDKLLNIKSSQQNSFNIDSESKNIHIMSEPTKEKSRSYMDKILTKSIFSHIILSPLTKYYKSSLNIQYDSKKDLILSEISENPFHRDYSVIKNDNEFRNGILKANNFYGGRLNYRRLNFLSRLKKPDIKDSHVNNNTEPISFNKPDILDKEIISQSLNDSVDKVMNSNLNKENSETNNKSSTEASPPSIVSKSPVDSYTKIHSKAKALETNKEELLLDTNNSDKISQPSIEEQSNEILEKLKYPSRPIITRAEKIPRARLDLSTEALEKRLINEILIEHNIVSGKSVQDMLNTVELLLIEFLYLQKET